MTTNRSFRTFDEFYPFYLSEHSQRSCRRLHFIGTTSALMLVFMALFSQNWWLMIVALVLAYGLAWIGHFFFEHNRPATFKYPWLSFLGDWRMWWDMLTGKIPI